MSFLKRVVVGGGLGLLGGLMGGPAIAYAGWKLGGTLATGNPLHLIPGAGLLADGMDIASVGVEAMSVEASDIASSTTDIYGNEPRDVWGNQPVDGQGNHPRDGLGNRYVDGQGNLPRDAQGNPT